MPRKNLPREVHLIRGFAFGGDFYTACGHIYGPLRVTKNPAEVTCQNCQRSIAHDKRAVSLLQTRIDSVSEVRGHG